MGTRGTLKVYLNGELKIRQYNQWDSYPTGQGAGICEFMQYADNVHALARVLEDARFFTKEEVESIENAIKTNDFTNVDFDLVARYHTSVNRDYGHKFLHTVAGMCWKFMEEDGKYHTVYLIPDWELVFRDSIFGPFGNEEGNYVIELTKDGDEVSFLFKGEWHGIYREYPKNVLPTADELTQWENEGYDN